MKNINTKALMVVALVAASFISTPMMVSGYDYEDDYIFNQFDIGNPGQLITSFQGFGKIFAGLGEGGILFASIFEMLLNQTLTSFSESDILPGVFVLSASDERTYSIDHRDYGTGQLDYYMLPAEYNDTLIEFNTLGQAYCEVNKSGSYNFTVTKGASITLVIWDQDGSFIIAVEKLINFFNKILEYLEGPIPSGIPESLIAEGVEVISWFLIHINDIFTGDELFILNPNTWQKIEIEPDTDFKVTKTWKVTGTDWSINPGLDEEIRGNGAVESVINEWNKMAELNNDTYMQYLLRENEAIPSGQTLFTSFSFDLLQLWVKNFEIHINVAEILGMFGGGGIQVDKIFEGLNIEFYLFTHHLTGAFLYKDRFPFDERLTTRYVPLINASSGEPAELGDDVVYVPMQSEITHRLLLGDVDSFTFEDPHRPSSGANEFSWGLTLNNPEIVPVPVGVDLDSYFNPIVPESLSYIHFGFTFQPSQRSVATRDGGSIPVLYGAVKLVQNFGPWNSPITGDDHSSNNPIDNLDLAIIYVSTVLHFELDINTLGEGPDDTILNPDDDYNNATNRLRIGDYLGKEIAGKLDFIDIAGPEYEFGDELLPRSSAPASTSNIPVALLEYEMDRHDTFVENEDRRYETFATDIRLNIELNVFAYAVCFPEFETGTGIWHDPTFSVYMVFDAQGFWAIILLVAGVGLVGVATILIKRRKDARF